MQVMLRLGGFLTAVYFFGLKPPPPRPLPPDPGTPKTQKDK